MRAKIQAPKAQTNLNDRNRKFQTRAGARLKFSSFGFGTCLSFDAWMLVLIRPLRRRRLHATYAGGFGAFGAFFDVILDGFAILEGFESLPLDDGMMHEDVLRAVIRSDKAEALLIVEPLDLASG